MKAHSEASIEITWVLPQYGTMDVMRNGTVAVEEASDEVQEEVRGDVDAAKRQTLALSEPCLLQPSVEFDVAELDAISVAVLSDRRPGGIPSDTTEEGLHLVALG
jgi:hypothetical protein